MRFAGTWKQYSKKAIPQLTMIAFHRASLRNFKWPYQAKVMKILETVSNRIVRIRNAAPRNVLCYKLETRKASPKLLFRQTLSSGFHTTVLPFPFLLLIPSATLWEYASTKFCSLLVEFDKNFRKIERFMCIRDPSSFLRFSSDGYFCCRPPLVARKKRSWSKPAPACRNRSIRTGSRSSTSDNPPRTFVTWPREQRRAPETFLQGRAISAEGMRRFRRPSCARQSGRSLNFPPSCSRFLLPPTYPPRT